MNINKVQYISTLLTLGAAFTALIGIILYNKQKFTGTMVFLILAGLLGFPIGILFIIAGISIKVLAKKSIRTLQITDTESDVIIVENALGRTGSDFIKVFFTTLGILLNIGFWIVLIVYHGWTLIIALKASTLAFILTLIFPIISNIYWFIKMIDNSLYFWLAISVIIIKVVALIISSIFEE